MPEANTNDRNSHGSRVDEFRTAKLRRGSRMSAQDRRQQDVSGQVCAVRNNRASHSNSPPRPYFGAISKSEPCCPAVLALSWHPARAAAITIDFENLLALPPQ